MNECLLTIWITGVVIATYTLRRPIPGGRQVYWQGLWMLFRILTWPIFLTIFYFQLCIEVLTYGCDL